MMSEVNRYARLGELVKASPALLKLYPAMTVYVLGEDFDRVTAERDALQRRLNEADQRIDQLSQHAGERLALVPVERSYDVRAQMILAFNTSRQGGEDLDDALGAAYRAAFRYTPYPGEAPVAVMLDEREEFVAWVRREWPQAPLSLVRDLLPKDDPRYGEYCDEALQRAWVGWQARGALAGKSSRSTSVLHSA